VGKQLPMFTALHPRRAENSATPLRKPGVSQQGVEFSIASNLTLSPTLFSYVETRKKKEVVILKCVDLSCTTFMRSILGLIVVIRHELGFNRPVSTSSYSLFKGLPNQFVFVHVVNNSALYLASCCSFLLQVVASFICI
jgi:hypothetical protein